MYIKSLTWSLNFFFEVDSAGGKSQGVIHTCEGRSSVCQYPPWGLHCCCWTQGIDSVYIFHVTRQWIGMEMVWVSTSFRDLAVSHL